MTVGMAWGKWIERVAAKGARGNRPASQKTLEDYEFNWEHYVRPRWEFTALANITRGLVEEWLDGLATPAGKPASTYGKDRAAKYFTRLLDYAVVEGWVPINPARDRAGGKIATPEVESSKTQVRLTLPQLVRLAACAGEWQTFVLFTGLTGLRWGEVSTLRRKHFEFGDTPSVVVEKAVAKTRKQREVPVPKSVAALVEESFGGAAPEALAFPSPTGRVLDSKNFANRHYRPAGRLASSAVKTLQHALRVTDKQKRVQDGDTFKLVAEFGGKTLEALHRAQKSAGISVVDQTTPDLWHALGLAELERVVLVPGDSDFLVPTFHNLRHTAVSLAISAGANIKLVQRIAGHASATMTLDVYGDLFDDDLHDSAKRLNEALQEVGGFALASN
ncbi:tyrosine-type recombinase/integrase [Arthrobacter mobilis]|uniref:tyrosine-type recombinase/integrase n=1 Tax=Arthrobacter mobilis TaxID=2724944 RepID=UPI001FE87B44|nr:site-specific integrase [Arthrobacter mobilis]